MNEQVLEKMAAKCGCKPKIADAGAFLLVGVDRDAIGMGDGAALVRVGEDGKWKPSVLRMDCTPEETVDVIPNDDLYDDEPDGNEFLEEQEKAADCQIEYFGQSASVCFHAHVNRTNDGLRIKEDFVSVAWGDSSREIPIVYWNTGHRPIKADGTRILPGGCHVVLPGDLTRVKRRALKQEQDECLAALIQRCSEEQAQATLEAVTAQIMEWKPDWTEEQARIAARMFLNQEQGQSA